MRYGCPQAAACVAGLHDTNLSQSCHAQVKATWSAARRLLHSASKTPSALRSLQNQSLLQSALPSYAGAGGLLQQGPQEGTEEVTPTAAVRRGGAAPTPSNTPAVGASTLGRLLSFAAEGLGTPDENGSLVSRPWAECQEGCSTVRPSQVGPACCDAIRPLSTRMCHIAPAHAGADCCCVQGVQQVPALQEGRFARSVSIPPSLSGSRSRVSSPTFAVGEPQCLTLTC